MSELTDVIGAMPYRMALAGGWIDQPFLSQLNPEPPGSMVVVALHPTARFMDRCGMGTSTRKIAMKMWGERLPDRDPAELVRELYNAENANQPEPSGAQDMAGLIYPGVSRLDFDYNFEGGYFPCHVESNTDEAVARWIEDVFYFVPVAQRPAGYWPLDRKNLDTDWIGRLSQSGKDCYDALVGMDLAALGASMNECMVCWETIMPDIVHHHTLTVDLMGLWRHYADRYPGAMYSGCGGGYIFVVSEEPVPGGFPIKVRTA